MEALGFVGGTSDGSVGRAELSQDFNFEAVETRPGGGGRWVSRRFWEGQRQDIGPETGTHIRLLLPRLDSLPARRAAQGELIGDNRRTIARSLVGRACALDSSWVVTSR